MSINLYKELPLIAKVLLQIILYTNRGKFSHSCFGVVITTKLLSALCYGQGFLQHMVVANLTHH